MQFHDRIWGPDVSSWQGDIDWKAVKDDGASFGITKVTEGIEYENLYAKGSWDGMGENGLVRVQYHYARPSINSASAEALYFLNRHLPLEVGDIIALDLEQDYRDRPFVNGAYWATTWLDTVANRLGFAPMLYCNGGIISERNQRFSDMPNMGQKYGLWLASWQDVFPKAYEPWQFVALWQFTNAAMVKGIAGPVDCNIFNGTLEQMKLYGMEDYKLPEVPAPADDPFVNWTTAMYRQKIKGLISAVGYMGGDLADKLVMTLHTGSGVPDIVNELRRVKKEQVG